MQQQQINYCPEFYRFANKPIFMFHQLKNKTIAMIEKYFKQGIRIQWTKPPNIDGPRDGKLVDSTQGATPIIYKGLGEIVDPMLMMINASSLGLQMRSAITPHTWLSYVPGRTSQVPQGGYDVLTGFMSGCIIARWMNKGVNFVGHVGTVEADHGVNRIVKRAFGFAMPKGTTGFDPFKTWGEADITSASVNMSSKLKRVMVPKIAALVTSQGEFHSILLFHDGMNEWYCGGIRRAQPMQHDTLKMYMMHD
jgi:hypothetical protein